MKLSDGKLFGDEVPVDFGRLLEDQLSKWKGGGLHPAGIGEYITNADDSYRRMRKFFGQKIKVEIHSRYGRNIDKLIISDNAEGMSYDDLEKKFFRYFESHSGRRQGEPVTGQFGTGGKAYAIMNFKQCWITSVKNGLECKAWFRWDETAKKIVKGYTHGGHSNKKTDKPNGTTIELLNGYKNNIELTNFMVKLNELARIRHVIKNAQLVTVSVFVKKNPPVEFDLEYSSPKVGLVKEWRFPVPETIANNDPKQNELLLRYFEKPIDSHSFIDLSDGISSVADLSISDFDNRPFSKYINGEMTVKKLQRSAAVKENRKGLEEGNDLTNDIESFLEEKISVVINEIQDQQRQKERERRIEVSNEKIKELNKFLKKCDLNFRSELAKSISVSGGSAIGLEDTNEETELLGEGFVKSDETEDLVTGTWSGGSGSKTGGNQGGEKFDPNEDDVATAVQDEKPKKESNTKTTKRGLVVLMSDSPEVPETERPVLSQYEEPVIDKDMTSKGIIWINANNPVIVKYRERKENEELFKEAVANYVLLVVAQFQAQTILDSQPVDERDDPMSLFRQKYFALQRELREDKEISYFEENSEVA